MGVTFAVRRPRCRSAEGAGLNSTVAPAVARIFRSSSRTKLPVSASGEMTWRPDGRGYTHLRARESAEAVRRGGWAGGVVIVRGYVIDALLDRRCSE